MCISAWIIDNVTWYVILCSSCTVVKCKEGETLRYVCFWYLTGENFAKYIWKWKHGNCSFSALPKPHNLQKNILLSSWFTVSVTKDLWISCFCRILTQGIGSGGKKSVHIRICVHTVGEYVQSLCEEGNTVGLIYLFMEVSLTGLKWHLCPKNWVVSVLVNWNELGPTCTWLLRRFTVVNSTVLYRDISLTCCQLKTGLIPQTNQTHLGCFAIFRDPIIWCNASSSLITII